jgi:hypothetical protein
MLWTKVQEQALVLEVFDSLKNIRTVEPSKPPAGEEPEIVRAQRDVSHLLEGTVMIRDEEIPMCRMELMAEYRALEMEGDPGAVPEQLGVALQPL